MKRMCLLLAQVFLASAIFCLAMIGTGPYALAQVPGSNPFIHQPPPPPPPPEPPAIVGPAQPGQEEPQHLPEKETNTGPPQENEVEQSSATQHGGGAAPAPTP